MMVAMLMFAQLADMHFVQYVLLMMELEVKMEIGRKPRNQEMGYLDGEGVGKEMRMEVTMEAGRDPRTEEMRDLGAIQPQR